MKALISSALAQQVQVKRVEGPQTRRVMDLVAVEEPLEIRLGYWVKDSHRTESLALTMRTPGHDRELALGFLYAEGVIRNAEEVTEIRSIGGDLSNELLVEVAHEVDVEMWRMSRATFVSSSCGVCGKRSIEAFTERAQVEADGFTVTPELIQRLPDLLNSGQAGFAQTGGLHAAALIGLEGELEAVFEDVGRHNALDKVVGWSMDSGHVPLAGRVLFLSSRSSFELVQKAGMAGASVLATVGGPSSLAIATARKLGITLIGFVRGERFNIYSGEWRIHS